MNGGTQLQQFSTAIDVMSEINATDSLQGILNEIVRQHNLIAREDKIPAYYGIKTKDIIINVLTRIN